MSLLDSENAKAAGNAALKAGDYTNADGHYTRALEGLPGKSPECISLCVVLLCNRSQARHQNKEFHGAIEDATAALQHLPENAPGVDTKMRVKALYRRALAREQVGDCRAAFHDVNLALKLAPTNEGLISAGKRLKDMLPPEPVVEKVAAGAAWKATHPFDLWYVMPVADSDSFPMHLRGYSGADVDPVVRFANGLGVKAHYPEGTLAAIQEFGPPGIASKEILNDMRDFHTKPNFALPDTARVVTYDKLGNLRSISGRKRGMLNGPFFTFSPTGALDHSKCGVYVDDELDSSIISTDLHSPVSLIARTLLELVIPVKKALDVGLSPAEEKLCDNLRFNTDCIRAVDLNEPSEAATQHTKWAADRIKEPLREHLLISGNGVAIAYPELPAHLRGASSPE